MNRLTAIAAGAALLLTALAAAPPTMPQPGVPGPGPAAPPMAPLPAATSASSATPAATPSVTPSPNPKILAQAKSWFAQLQTGKIDRSQLAPGMNLTDEQVKKAAAQLGGLGTPVTFEQQQTASQGGITYVLYLLTFGNSTKLDFGFGLNGAGQVALLRLMPVP